MKPDEKFFYAFYKAKKFKLYFNQIKELSNLSNASLVNLINKFKKENIIKSKITKQNTFYIISNLEYTFIYFLKFDLIFLNNLNYDVLVSLKEFKKNIPKEVAFVILFGSTIRNEQNNVSDIDILIVLNSFSDNNLQKKYEKYLKNEFGNLKNEINGVSIYPLSLFYTNIDEFRENKDRLLNEIKETGIPIFNGINYYFEVSKEW